METLIQKLTEVLQEEFPGCTLDMSIQGEGEDAGIYGAIIWAGFRHVEPRERVERILDVLRSRLNDQERKGVPMVLGYSPREWKMMHTPLHAA